MYIRVTTNTTGTSYYHLVESYRDQGKVSLCELRIRIHVFVELCALCPRTSNKGENTIINTAKKMNSHS